MRLSFKMLHNLALAISMIAISGFGTACMTNNPGAAINRRIANPFDASALIPVFFATNRVPISLKPACDDSYYGVRNSREMRYGACEINVPKIHTVGSLATGSSDRDRSFKTGALQEAQSGGLIRKIASTPGDEVLLFVHGFNVKFEEALLRAAQIAYDTKFQGATVLFTWPAGAGEDSLSSVLIHRTYAANQTNARDSVALFAQFVRDLRSTGKTVHILVHSMGHQIVLPALAQLAETPIPGNCRPSLCYDFFPGDPMPKTTPAFRLASSISVQSGCQGPIAQWLERPAHNRLVPGSNPGGPTGRHTRRGGVAQW